VLTDGGFLRGTDRWGWELPEDAELSEAAEQYRVR
jgi:hypothetical protein